MKEVIFFDGDLDKDALHTLLMQPYVGIDCETTGLDPYKDDLKLIQICGSNTPVYVIRFTQEAKPYINLAFLLMNKQIAKIFHFAMFDLRFILNRKGIGWWDVENIICTKIASKVLHLIDNSDPSKHRLANLLKDRLNVRLDKDPKIRLSDWSGKLNEAQIKYIINDMIYLIPLFKSIRVDLRTRNLYNLSQRCWDSLPFKLELEHRNMKKVFDY